MYLKLSSISIVANYEVKTKDDEKRSCPQQTQMTGIKEALRVSYALIRDRTADAITSSISSRPNSSKNHQK